MRGLIELRPLWGAFLFALLATAIATDLLRRMLLRLGRVDQPRMDRWHRQPVPRPGGPAIALIVLAGMALFIAPPWHRPLWGLAAGGLLIFVVGLIDDLLTLSNSSKLTLLVLCAAVPLLFGVSFTMVPPPVAIPLSLLWILGMTNAVNWLDNMDGLAAGVSAIAAGTLAILSWGFGNSEGGTVAALVTGSCLGFLIFNFSPARIFMGDSGSGFLGFTLATLAILGTARDVTNLLVAFVVPVMVMSIPIFDSAVVTLARIASGRRLFQGGRDHPSHRLVVLGLSERQTALYLYVLSALSAVAAVLTTRMGAWAGIVLLGVLVCVFFGASAVVARVRVYQEHRPARSGATAVIWQAVRRRHLVEVMLDLLLLTAAYLGAYLLRFEGAIPEPFVPIIAQSLPIVLAVKIVILQVTGVSRSDYRYVGLLDIFGVIRALTLGSLVAVVLLFIVTRLAGYSRAVFIIDWLLSLGLLISLRVSARILEDYVASRRVRGRRVLIAGAGHEGVMLLQELWHNPALAYYPVGFVDDDPANQRATIQGLRVLGGSPDIPALAQRYRIEEVLIAAPAMTPEELDRVAQICTDAAIPYRTTQQLINPVG